MSLRNPEVRQTLLKDVATLADGEARRDEIALGDAVEEVDHLLDPRHDGEPGDVLMDSEEVEAATALWHALNRVAWPLDSQQRATSKEWNEVVRVAQTFLARCRREP